MGIEKLKVRKYQQVQNQKCWKSFFISISVPRKYPRNGKATLLDISCSWPYDPKYEKNVSQTNFLSKVFQRSWQSQQVVAYWKQNNDFYLNPLLWKKIRFIPYKVLEQQYFKHKNKTKSSNLFNCYRFVDLKWLHFKL